MRLYLNTKEARLIRATILVSIASMTKEQQETAHKVIDRLDLCEKVQKSEREAKNNDH